MDAYLCCVKMYETIYYKPVYKLNTRNYISQDIKKTFARMDFFTCIHTRIHGSATSLYIVMHLVWSVICQNLLKYIELNVHWDQFQAIFVVLEN